MKNIGPGDFMDELKRLGQYKIKVSKLENYEKT